MMKAQLRLKKITQGKKRERWNREKLKGEQTAEFATGVTKCLETSGEGPAISVEDKWNKLKSAILESGKENIGYNKRKRTKKPWITEEMLNKMDERRKWKRINTQDGKRQYKRLNNELRRETDSARERWWTQECEELEKLDREGKSDRVYAKVKELCAEKKNCRTKAGILSKDGHLLTDPLEVKDRWKQYIEELYAKDDRPAELPLEPPEQVDLDDIGPQLLG